MRAADGTLRGPCAVRLDYGTDGLDVDLPDDRRHGHRAGVPAGGRRRARRRCCRRSAHPIDSAPLRQLVQPGQRVAISVCDITRAQPRRETLRALFEEMPDMRRAGRHHPHRHRHAPHRTPTPSSSGCSGATSSTPAASSTTTAATRRRWRTSGRTSTGVPRVPEPRMAGRPTSASPPASSSRTSSPASAAARRWWRPAWPGSTR